MLLSPTSAVQFSGSLRLGAIFVLLWVYSAGYFKFLPDRSVFLLGCFGVWAYLVNALAGFIFDLRWFLLHSSLSLFCY